VPPGIRPNPDPKGEGYMLSGNAPIYAILREARDRAKATGTKDIEERPIVGDAVHALVDLAEEVHPPVRLERVAASIEKLQARFDHLAGVPPTESARGW
jgi:hypothetical protein